jgi:hypothetical protein
MSFSAYCQNLVMICKDYAGKSEASQLEMVIGGGLRK